MVRPVNGSAVLCGTLTDAPLDLGGLDFLDTRKAAAIVEEFKNGNNHLSHLVWSIVGLSDWLRRH